MSAVLSACKHGHGYSGFNVVTIEPSREKIDDHFDT